MQWSVKTKHSWRKKKSSKNKGLNNLLHPHMLDINHDAQIKARSKKQKTAFQKRPERDHIPIHCLTKVFPLNPERQVARNSVTCSKERFERRYPSAVHLCQNDPPSSHTSFTCISVIHLPSGIRLFPGQGLKNISLSLHPDTGVLPQAMRGNPPHGDDWLHSAYV